MRLTRLDFLQFGLELGSGQPVGGLCGQHSLGGVEPRAHLADSLCARHLGLTARRRLLKHAATRLSQMGGGYTGYAVIDLYLCTVSRIRQLSLILMLTDPYNYVRI